MKRQTKKGPRRSRAIPVRVRGVLSHPAFSHDIAVSWLA